METDETTQPTVQPTSSITTDSPSLPQPNAPRHLMWSTRVLWGVIAFVPLLALITAMSASTRSTTLLFGTSALVWSALCFVFFVSHLFRLPITTTRRNLWAVALLLVAPIALPAFWWTKIFHAPVSSVQHS